MSGPFEELSNLNRLIHEPARLAILTALAACRSADFRYLQSVTGLTVGNLSRHLGKLEAGGLVAIEKSFKRKVPHTELSLTAMGRDAIEDHWVRLGQVRRSTRRWWPKRVRPPATE